MVASIRDCPVLTPVSFPLPCSAASGTWVLILCRSRSYWWLAPKSSWGFLDI
jgi:hypothetical protein